MNTEHIKIKASFIVEDQDHIIILREKESACVKEFNFLMYESDISNILKKEDSKYELYELLNTNYYFYEYLMYHNLEYIHFHYLKFIHEGIEYTFTYSTEDDFENYWIDSGTYGEHWMENGADCYRSVFGIDDSNDDWKL